MNSPVQHHQFDGVRLDGLRSLWDMVANHSFGDIAHLLDEIRVLIVTSNHNMRYIEQVGSNNPILINDPKGSGALKDCADGVTFVTDQAGKLLSGLKCAHINTATVNLRHWLKQSPQTWPELNTRSRALRDVIETELKGHLYYQYPKDKAQKLRAWKIDWYKAFAAFPDIEKEVFSAIDCYAMEQNTAAVFHSMRVAEHGLRVLAHERKIKLPKNKPLEWATWQEIIKALDDEIKVIASKKAGNAKDAALAFYSGARADLNGFKDEYRNLVMHVRAIYDEFQALRALTNVHAFMERLSAKTDHTHKRIKWGKF